MILTVLFYGSPLNILIHFTQILIQLKLTSVQDGFNHPRLVLSTLDFSQAIPFPVNFQILSVFSLNLTVISPTA